MAQGEGGRVADAPKGHWVYRLVPEFARPYAQLMRLDRPVGYWLLFWPCAFSVGLAAIARPMLPFGFGAIALFLIGAIAMRGAGCTFNDIVDRDIDEKVARTRSRPIPSGRVSVWQAVAFLVAQALVGLVVLVQFNAFTVWLGVASLITVAVYPFMKRITWWPQLFLGLAFSWGALMGWAGAFGALYWPAIVLYLGSILWVIGYDTLYALQDIEDDALVGVKSTARLFGARVRPIVALFYLGAFALWMAAAALAGAGLLFFASAVLPAALLVWQVVTLDPSSPANALTRFKANHYVGLALTLAMWIEYRF